MKYDKMRGDSAAECMMKVRSKYGSSAIILQTREIKEGGILGMMARTVYEVHFMVEEAGDSKKTFRKSEILQKLQEKEIPAEKSRKIETQTQEEISETFSRLQKKRDRLSQLIQEKSKQSESNDRMLEKKSVSGVSPEMTREKKSPAESAILLGGADPVSSSIFSNPPPAVYASPVGFKGLEESVSISGEEIHALMKWEDKEIAQKTFDDFQPSEFDIPEMPRDDQSSFRQKQEPVPLDRGERNIHKIRTMLLGAQLSRELTESLIRDLDHELSRKEKNEYRLIESKMLARLSEMIQTVPDIAPKKGECRAVMLIGPTGAGKTTSIAKIAAKYHLIEKRDVSLYSLDHYRLAATEQLKIYADVMNVPFFAPVNPEEFQEFLNRDGAEIMLIDTSGIGISDQNRLKELKRFVDVCNVRLEKHLVIAASTGNRTLEKIIQVYDDNIGFDKILLTKVDETDFFGAFVEYADKLNRPFSFLTNGQEVPGDLIAPKPEELARMVLGEAVLHAG